MPAGRPKSIENKKVFDVAKPGKSKPISTSRPVIINRNDIVTDNVVVSQPDKSLSPPSASRKIIQPMSDQNEADQIQDENKSSITVLVEPRPTKTAPVVDEAALQVESSETVTAVGEKAEDEPQEADPEDNKSTEPEGTPDKPTLDIKTPEVNKVPVKTVNETPESEPSQTIEVKKVAKQTEVETESEAAESEPANSESATVDALAEASEKTKLDKKLLEEQEKKETELQELIASKKYVVPLAHDSTKKSGYKTALVLFLVVVVLAVGAYLAIDAELIDTNIQLPYNFID